MDDPAEDIMGATFRALCDHGYADLTMRDIAEESDRSKAALHYHYDDKEGLLVAFLDHLYDSFTDRLGEYAIEESPEAVGQEAAEPPAFDPDERLRAFVDAALHPPADGEAREFRTAMLEIKAQAPYQDAFQERIARFDRFVTDTVRDLVVAGQAAGVYRDAADPDHVAQFVLTVFDGAGARHVVADAPVECALASIEDYLDGHLLVEAERPDGSAAESQDAPVTDGGGEDGDEGSAAEGSR